MSIESFLKAMEDMGLSKNQVKDLTKYDSKGYWLPIRPSFTLGGSGIG